MDFIIGIISGAIGGSLMVGFIIGASRVNYENEIYMEGHIEGYAEGYAAGQNDALKEGKEDGRCKVDQNHNGCI